VRRFMLLELFEEVPRDKKHSKPNARIVVFDKSKTYFGTAAVVFLEPGIPGSCHQTESKHIAQTRKRIGNVARGAIG